MSHHSGSSPLLVERERELEQLHDGLTAAAAGRGGMVVIEGLPGLGKTALPRTARRPAEERGFQVARSRGHPVETDMSYGIARQLFERMSRSIEPTVLTGVAELAASVFVPTGEVEASPFPTMHGLYWLVTNLAERQPLLVAVDDAQWADAASIRWLSYLAGRLEDLPVLVIVARWPQTSGPPTPDLDALTSDRSADPLRITELTLDGVGAVATELLGHAVDPTVQRSLHTRTGGNPFLVHEFVVTGCEGTDPAVPTGIVRFASSRVAALSSQSRALANAVAVLGDGARGADARAVARLAGTESEQAHNELVRASIFADRDELVYAHPVLREAVYATLLPGDIAAIHGDAAKVLADRGADVESIAVHLLHSTPDNNDEAVGILREAARRCRSRGDHRPAVAFLDRAVLEASGCEPPCDLLLELGTSLSLVDASRSAEVLRQAQRVAPDPNARLDVAIELVQTLVRLADLQGAYEALESAIDALPGDADRERWLAAEAGLLTLGGLAPALFKRAETRARAAPLVEGKTPGERLTLSGLVRIRTTGSAPWGDLLDVTRSAIGGGQILTDQAPDAGVVTSVAWPLIVGGAIDEATELVDKFFALAASRGAAPNIALATHLHAVIAMARGNVTAALEHSQRAIEVALSTDYYLLLPTAAAFRIRALIEVGDITGAEALLATYGLDGDLPDLAVMFRTALKVRAELRLAQGRPADALADLLDLGRRDDETGTEEESSAWRTHASMALIELGRVDEAAELARYEVDRARAKGVGPTEARALASLGRATAREQSLEHLTRALDLFSSMPFDLDRARTLVEYGRALMKAGNRPLGQTTLLEALDVSSRLGATVLAGAATAELRTCGLRPRRTALTGVAALTPSERRIADIAATGATNDEIAQRLFVTRKNVEFHLTNAYRKLGVTSRRGLGAAMDGTG
jgi:DNA-binding CsgD family transcriptional regulator